MVILTYMMIKITEHCSMGCTHCMNNATPNNKHMNFNTFKDAVEFQKTYGGPFVIISGGEPTEHPEFKEFLSYLHSQLEGAFITITTNGLWLEHNYDYIKYLYENFPYTVFQVTSVKEYYPKQIDLDNPVYSLKNVVVCDVIESMYPMGRALDNNFPSNSKGSKCINIRLVTKQVAIKDLRLIFSMMAAKGKFCTPHIAINGDIKLGESDLCPKCSSIYKTNNEIVQDIMKFKCSKCNHVNCNLSSEVLNILGDV